MSVLNFDASRVAPSTGELDPIPAAWYIVMMDKSELVPTKDAATTGHAYLECRFNVADGQFAGRKLFARLNLRNSNPVAAEIAQKELSAICHAVGIMQVQDSQQLHGIPMKVKVKLKPATAQYSASNEISTFKPISFVPDAPAGTAPMGAAPFQAPMAPPMAPQAAWQPPAGMGQPPQAPQQYPQAPQQAAAPVYYAPPTAPQADAAPPAWGGAAPQQPWQQPVQQAAQPVQQPAPPQYQQPAPAAAPVAPAAPQFQQPAPQGMPPGAGVAYPAAPGAPQPGPVPPWQTPAA
jgi:hypothetical protein